VYHNAARAETAIPAPRSGFSTPWKNIRRVFHAMENPDFRPGRPIDQADAAALSCPAELEVPP
jgi:hypothetical protein